MTCFYSTWFVLVWGSLPLAIAGAIASLVVGLTDHGNPVRLWLGVGGALLLTVYTLIMRLHSIRVAVRAGAFPAWFCGDAAPRDEAGVERFCRSLAVAPSVVGGGWSFYLQRRGPPAPRLFTHRFTGPSEVDEQGNVLRWKGGTTVGEVVKYAKANGDAFDTNPSITFISLGAWFASASHGSGGPAAKGSSYTLVDARVMDMETMKVDSIDYQTLRQRFDESPKRHIILDVALKFRKNVRVWRETVFIRSADDAAQWLAPTSSVRFLFLGAARSYAIATTFTKLPVGDGRVVDHPHDCSKFCGWLQADICSAWCGCAESRDKWTGVHTLADAHNFVPQIFPFQTTLAVLLGIKNFEVFCILPGGLNGNSLFDLITRLRLKVHARHGGRTEVRNGDVNGWLFLDMSLRGGFRSVFEVLLSMGVRRCALHAGKYQVSTFPLERIPPYQL